MRLTSVQVPFPEERQASRVGIFNNSLNHSAIIYPVIIEKLSLRSAAPDSLFDVLF
jgi:hypothetical protein